MISRRSRFIVLISTLFLPTVAAAQDIFGLDKAAYNTGLRQVPVEILAANIIQVVLGFVGIIFLLLVIYGGFQWMIGGRDGNEENIRKAKQTITTAAIGLIVILAAYSLTYYITTYVLQATQTTP